LVVWLPTTKSQESTPFLCVQMACDISMTCDILLESSQWGLQLHFRLHLNQRSARKVMAPQSRKSFNLGNFGTPTWESRDKKSFGCGPVERCRLYYKREGGGFPQVQAVVSLMCPCYPWFILAPKVLQLCTNHLALILCRSMWVDKAFHLFLVASQSSSTPLYPSKVLGAREHASTPYSFVVFCLGLTFESLKELGVCQEWRVSLHNWRWSFWDMCCSERAWNSIRRISKSSKNDKVQPSPKGWGPSLGWLFL
jgi:hypothetical protein